MTNWCVLYSSLDEIGKQTYQRIVARQIEIYNQYGLRSVRQLSPNGVEYELNPFSLPSIWWSHSVLPEALDYVNKALSQT